MSDETWKNWSGSTRHHGRLASAAREEEIVEIIQAARKSGQRIRPRGAGHSFSPLCGGGDILLDLDKLAGVVSIDKEKRQARILAGTRLKAIGAPLNDAGFALANQGDIDVQSLGGLLSTGTHGTGYRLTNSSAQIAGLRLVLADGNLCEVTEQSDPQLFAAARISLGALGILVACDLKLVPRYCLQERNRLMETADCIAAFPEMEQRHRNVEFFWLPPFDKCVVKTLDVTDEPPLESGPPAPLPPPGKIERYLQPDKRNWSHKIYPSDRTVPFNEMEYSLPADQGLPCFGKLRALMQKDFADVTWAVEYRTLAPDTAFLSQAYGRQSVCISIHQDAKLDCQPFFAAAEKLFLAHGGRPHWGKVHYAGASVLKSRYAKWEDFKAARRRVDPDGLFLNDHLAGLFEVAR